MIWQWIIIAILVAVAGIYLFRIVRRTLGAPYCPDCSGCKPKRWAKIQAKFKPISKS